jgi:hypothetical protein
MASSLLMPDMGMGESTTVSPPPSPAGLSESKAHALESEIVQWTDKLFDTATQDREYERHVRETFRVLDSLDGKMWPSQARRGRNRSVLPKTERLFWDGVGLLTDLAIDFQVRLWNREGDFNDMEKMLNDLVLHWVMQSSYPEKQYDVILYGLLNTGPAKIQWNSELAGGMGDVDMVPIAPWQWATLGAGNNPQDAECIIYFPVVTKEHLIRKFGPTARRVQCDSDYSAGALQGQFHRPKGFSKSQWANMAQTLKISLGIKADTSADDSPYPMALKKEFWMNDDSTNDGSSTVTVGPADSNGNPRVNWAYRVEPGERLYPRGRVIVTAGGCVLEDQPNPYWHSKKPFPVYRPLRVPWKSNGQSSIRPWMQMNMIINRVLAGMQDYLDSVIEPTLVGPKGAMPAGDWDALDPGAAGGKIKYNNNAPKPPEFMKKAEFPIAAAKQFVDDVSRELDMNSGSSAIQQAMSKKQVPGSDSLDTILNSRSLPIRVKSRALASFAEEGGAMVISNMLQFYTVGHRTSILGKEGFSASDYRPVYGSAIPSGMQPEEFVRRFGGTVRRDTILESQRDSEKQVALALSKMGKLSDQNLFKVLKPGFNFLENQKQLLQEARLKILVAAAAAAAQGKGQGQRKK